MNILSEGFPKDPKGDRVTDRLPHYIKEQSIGFQKSSEANPDVILSFMEKHWKPDVYANVKKNLSKNFILGKYKVKPDLNSVPRNKKTHLSLREKRKLGLYKIPRKGMNYQEFLKLHDLWKQYMLDSLDFSRVANKEGEVDVQDKNWEQLSAQLYKADYHGAHVTVVRSTCPSHVGLKGIVVMDTKGTFKVLGEDNVTRTIPKETTVFKIKVGRFILTVYGKHLCIKPAERTTKKIRNNLSKIL